MVLISPSRRGQDTKIDVFKTNETVFWKCKFDTKPRWARNYSFLVKKCRMKKETRFEGHAQPCCLMASAIWPFLPNTPKKGKWAAFYRLSLFLRLKSQEQVGDTHSQPQQKILTQRVRSFCTHCFVNCLFLLRTLNTLFVGYKSLIVNIKRNYVAKVTSWTQFNFGKQTALVIRFFSFIFPSHICVGLLTSLKLVETFSLTSEEKNLNDENIQLFLRPTHSELLLRFIANRRDHVYTWPLSDVTANVIVKVSIIGFLSRPTFEVASSIIRCKKT